MFIRKTMERVFKVYWIPYTFTDCSCFTKWSWPPQVEYHTIAKENYICTMVYYVPHWANQFQLLVAIWMDTACCVMEGGWKHATCRNINDTSRFIWAETKLVTIIGRHYYDKKWTLFTIIYPHSPNLLSSFIWCPLQVFILLFITAGKV